MKPIIIAEAGVNHNGSLKTALQMVDAAALAGADFVKFQTFKTDSLVTASVKTAEYQKANCNADTQRDMLRKLELPLFRLQDSCRPLPGKGHRFSLHPFRQRKHRLSLDSWHEIYESAVGRDHKPSLPAQHCVNPNPRDHFHRNVNAC